MKLILTVITLLSVLLTTFSSHADFFYNAIEIKECKAKHQNPTDYTLCLDASYVKIERELMTWETNLEIKLQEATKGGNTDALRLHKSALRYFNKYKKATCQSQYLAVLPDVTSAIIMAKECELYITKDRIQKLQELSNLKF